jgi:hypothetical protein
LDSFEAKARTMSPSRDMCKNVFTELRKKEYPKGKERGPVPGAQLYTFGETERILPLEV